MFISGIVIKMIFEEHVPLWDLICLIQRIVCMYVEFSGVTDQRASSYEL